MSSNKWTRYVAAAALGMGVVFNAGADSYEDYAKESLIPYLDGLSVLKQELKAANTARAGLGNYDEAWKGWDPATAEANQNTLGYSEYRWSARKDRGFMAQHMGTPAAQALKQFQEASGGKVQEFFITGARGGNVAQTQPTSDWFQGDEDKFAKAANTHEVFYDKVKRDETVGADGRHVCIPLWDSDTFLGVAVVFVVE